jgi:hypothetical protein
VRKQDARIGEPAAPTKDVNYQTLRTAAPEQSFAVNGCGSKVRMSCLGKVEMSS